MTWGDVVGGLVGGLAGVAGICSVAVGVYARRMRRVRARRG